MVLEFARAGLHRADGGHGVAGVGLGGVINDVIDKDFAGALDGERRAEFVGAGGGDFEDQIEVAAFPGAQLGKEQLASGGFGIGSPVVAVATEFEIGRGLGGNGFGFDPAVFGDLRIREGEVL